MEYLATTLARMGWEFMNHLPYSLDLTSSDFHLFRPTKAHTEVQKFQTDDEIKCGVLN
jgi:hypothetical protein